MDDGEAWVGEPQSAVERAMSGLMADAHVAGPHDLPRLFEEHAAQLGLRDTVTYLADLQQQVLLPFVERGSPHRHQEWLGIDSTLAGRAFQQLSLQSQPADGGGTRLWIPLLDGAERIGVMATTTDTTDALDGEDGLWLERLRTLASVAAELLVTKTLYGDTIVRLRRTSAMGLAAEIQWSLLPPLTFASPDVTVSAGLEPAYEVAGDSVDYAVDAGTARFAIFDGMGHGLRSAQLVTMAVAAYRNARRSAADLATAAAEIDEALAETFGGAMFSTGLLAELDTADGRLTWVNAGHLDPLLLRDGRIVKHLHTEPVVPFGIAAGLGVRERAHLGTEDLQPGDIVLLYTDGVIEARSPEGEFFGLERLVDLISRNLASGLPAPESLRRLIRALLEHQQGQLTDDATLMIVQWRPDNLAPYLFVAP